MHAVCTVLSEEIFTGAASSAVRVFKDPPVVNWNVTSRLIPIDMNTVGVSPRATNKILTGTGTSAPPICVRGQETGSPRGSVSPQKVRNAHPFKSSIEPFSPEHRHLTPIFSEVTGLKTVPDEISDVYACKSMDFGRSSVVAASPNFMDFGLSLANTPDKIKSVIVPTTRFGRSTNGSDRLQPRHDIEILPKNSKQKKVYTNYILNNEFETMKEIQYFD